MYLLTQTVLVSIWDSVQQTQRNAESNERECISAEYDCVLSHLALHIQ